MPLNYRNEYKRYQHYYTNLQRFYQKPTARVSVFVVVSFMTVSFFSIFAIKPTLTTIGQLIKDIDDKRTVDTQLQQKLVDLAKAQTEYANIKNELPLVAQALPDKPGLERLLVELELVAAKQQVKILTLQVDPVTLLGKSDKSSAQEGVDKIGFNLLIGGNYDQLKAFMVAVTNIDRVIGVKEINLASGTPFLKKQGVGITLGLTGEAYYTPVENQDHAS